MATTTSSSSNVKPCLNRIDLFIKLFIKKTCPLFSTYVSLSNNSLIGLHGPTIIYSPSPTLQNKHATRVVQRDILPAIASGRQVVPRTVQLRS